MKPTPTPEATSRAEAKPKALDVFQGGWCDEDFDAMSGKAYHTYEFYDGQVEIIEAVLEASPTSTKGELAAAIRYALDAGAYDKKTGLRMIQQSWLDQKFAPILARLESSPPTDYTDIVGLREKVEAEGKKYLDERDREYESLKDEEEDEMGRDWAGHYMAAESNKKAGAKEILEIVLALLPPNPKAVTSGEGQ